jgi:hypothetical protein
MRFFFMTLLRRSSIGDPRFSKEGDAGSTNLGKIDHLLGVLRRGQPILVDGVPLPISPHLPLHRPSPFHPEILFPLPLTEDLSSSIRPPSATTFANLSRLLTCHDSIGETVQSIGMSHIRFNSAGQVVLHQDYWDSGSNLFEHIPVVGWLIRRIKARL